MVISFRIISNENEEFLRDITIDGSDTFFDLHKFIQDNLGFDPTQMTSFFITDQEWNKEQEITLFDMNADSESEIKIMECVQLEELISEEKQRLLYVFDIFSERALFIETYAIESDSNTANPLINKAIEDAPEQISLASLFSDDDMDFIGGNEPDDDFDLDSLEDINGENDFLSYTDDLESYN